MANSSSKKYFSVYSVALIAMFSAIAFILTLIHFPIPIAPSFYKLDVSELPVLIGTFALGPIAGIIIEALKILLHLLVSPTTTAYVGEASNFLCGIALVLPAGIIYKCMHTKKGAFISLAVGIVVGTLVATLLNAYVLLPLYSKLFFQSDSLDKIIAMGNAIFSAVTNRLTFCLLIVAPFNLIKTVLVSLLTMLLYKHVSRLIESVGKHIRK